MQLTYNNKHPWPVSESKQNVGLKIMFFILWPFGAWLYCLRNPRSRVSYAIFFMFSLLLLWHMAPTNFGDGYHDFLGIKERFDQAHFTTLDIKEECIKFFTFADDAPKEVYEDVLTWFVKQFTDNYHFFFLLAAIPVAFFQLRSLRRVTSDSMFIPGFFGLIAMIMMILPRDMVATQNPRFTTGFWLAVFCSLYCFSEKKIKLKYILPLLLLPAIHGGLWPCLIMTLVFLIIPKNIKVLKLIAIITIPFVFIDPQIVSYFDFSILPDSFSWIERGFSEENYAIRILHEGRAGFWWVDAFFTWGLKITLLCMAIMLFRNEKAVHKNTESHNFYSFFLFSFAYINLMQFFPEAGNRYYGMWKIFVFYTWYKTFHFSKPVVYYLLLFFCSWYMLNRYGYVLGGALSVNTPLDIFITPLPYLVGKGLWWGV